MGETVSPLRSVAKYLHLLSQFFIAVGILTLLFKRMDTKLEREYEAFSLVFFVICFAGVAVPYFASSLNTTRLYQITLIFLAPFCVIGGITVFKILSRVVRESWTDQRARNSLKVLSVFFTIFLLFNIGFVYEVAKNYPNSISLSQESIKKYGDVKQKAALYNGYIPEHDAFSAMWLSNNRKSDYKIYSDEQLTTYKCHVLISIGGIFYTETSSFTNTTSKITINSYIYLRYLNIVHNIAVYEKTCYNITEVFYLVENTNEIYSNGGSEIYKK
jgi:uncharacterized membrane protein